MKGGRNRSRNSRCCVELMPSLHTRINDNYTQPQSLPVESWQPPLMRLQWLLSAILHHAAASPFLCRLNTGHFPPGLWVLSYSTVSFRCSAWGREAQTKFTAECEASKLQHRCATSKVLRIACKACRSTLKPRVGQAGRAHPRPSLLPKPTPRTCGFHFTLWTRQTAWPCPVSE